MKVVQNFELERYLGTWYEAYRSKAFRYGTGECVTADYSMRPDGYIKVFNSEMKYLPDKKTLDTSKRNFKEGWAYWVNPEKKEATLGVKFSIFQPWYATYNVMDTDYDTYAYIYSGSPGGWFGIGRYQLCWVLTRKPLSKDSEELKDIHDRAKNFLEAEIPGFNFDEAMRHTL